MSMKIEHIRDESGRTIRSIGMVHDITERTQTEKALVRAKLEWERTFDSVPDMIAILDNEHRIVRVNRAMAEQIGLNVDQCVGLPCYKYVHGMSEPPAFCPHSKTIENGCQHFFELYEERLGGDMLVSTTPILNNRGEITGSVHVARNISELKQTEKKLLERQMFIEQIAQTSPNILYVFDIIENKLVYANEQLSNILGYDLEQIQEMGQSIYQELIHPDDYQRHTN